MSSGDITKELLVSQERILAELGELRSIVNGFGNKIASLETKLASVETRLASVETRLASVEIAVEKKLMETKPIWVAELDNKIDGLRDHMDRGFRDLGREIGVLGRDVIRVRANQDDFDKRLSELEHV